MLRTLVRHLTKNIDAKLFSSRGLCSSKALNGEEKPEDVAEKVEEAPKNVLLEKDSNITLIGINRPQTRNAINFETATQISEAFQQFENDDESPVAVLYGLGGSFCAGYDLQELGKEDQKVTIDLLMAHEGSVGPTRRHIKKPVLCAINGFCVANGLELALMCDLRIMEECATLGFFNRRFGVPLIDGGTVRLPAMVGFSRALDIILTGRHVLAKEAYEIGIANRVVPKGYSLIKAMELAKQLAKFPQRALLHDRNSLYTAVFDRQTFSQAVQNEVMYTSKEILEEMQDGIQWFNETHKTPASESWLKRDKSMADWEDDELTEKCASKPPKEAKKEATEAK